MKKRWNNLKVCEKKAIGICGIMAVACVAALVVMDRKGCK